MFDQFYANDPRRQVRGAPSRYLDSRLRGTVEVGEGTHPSLYYFPYPALPIMFQDVTTELNIVLPMGRIVSAIGQLMPIDATAIPVTDNDEVTIGPAGDQDGNKPGYIDSDGTLQEVDATKSKYGYGPDVLGLLVPANGGNPGTDDITTLPLTAADNGVTWKEDLTGLVVDGTTETCLIPTNYPLGVVHSDIYQDCRGRYLNSEMFNQPVGVLTDWHITLPYVACDNAAANAVGVEDFVDDDSNLVNFLNDGDLTVANDAGYAAAYKYYSFFYFDYANILYEPMPGAPLISDSFGNFIPQEHAAGSRDAAMDAALNAQTIGRLIGTDCKYPKGALETVSTFPGSENPGTQTLGIDWTIFYFAKLALNGSQASSTYATPAVIFEAIVTDKIIGAAHISLGGLL